MTIPDRLYTAAIKAAAATTPLLSRGEGKLARSIRGRIGVLERMEAWAEQHRDPGRPLVWFHAPSVGEGLQAKAVVEAFRRKVPAAQIVYTYFSASAESFARTVPGDFVDYLPFDLPIDISRALDALRPNIIAFSKTDVWPNLTRLASARGVGLALLSATLPAGSSRLSGAARALLSASYQRLDQVAAISEADADRFGSLGVDGARRTVMGDARFDQVWDRAMRVDRESRLLAPLISPKPTLVAGSTWPEDEERILPALIELQREGAEFRTLLVPHEPTAAHLKATELRLSRAGLPHRRFDQPPASEEHTTSNSSIEVLLVDRTGILGDLYALADIAYVGGGFGRAGLHSVLEPAAFGAPVLFGPNHSNARDAEGLLRAGGAIEVRDSAALYSALNDFLRVPARLEQSGANAKNYVESGVGAADRGAAILIDLLSQRG